MNNIALDFVRRANSKGISINRLCREAGISRAWFEKLKNRVPCSVDLYLKINNTLNNYESNGSENKIQYTSARQILDTNILFY